MTEEERELGKILKKKLNEGFYKGLEVTLDEVDVVADSIDNEDSGDTEENA